MRRSAVLAVALLPSLAHAADVSPVPDAGGIVRAVVGLALVLGLVFLTGWILRRLNPQQSRVGSALRIVATQALGTRERVVVLEIADQWLVVGVAPGNVRSLATLPRGELPAAPAMPVNPFGTLLDRALRRGKDAS